MHTACVWSEKLPFAGYSVVKDHSASGFALRAICALRSLGPYAQLRSRADRVAVEAIVRCKSIVFQTPSTLRAEAGLSGPRGGKARQSRACDNGEYRARTGDLLVANQ